MNFNCVLVILIVILIIFARCRADYFKGKVYAGWYGDIWKSGVFGTDWGGWGWGYPTSYVNYNKCYFDDNGNMICPSIDRRDYDTPFLY
jgi:hypothetical protein